MDKQDDFLDRHGALSNLERGKKKEKLLVLPEKCILWIK